VRVQVKNYQLEITDYFIQKEPFRAVEGVNSRMIYLIHCKILCNFYSVPPPSTTIIRKKEKEKKKRLSSNSFIS
jgi:hypothetical protein